MNNIVENTTEVIHCRWFIARRLIGRFDSISQFFLLFINFSLYLFFLSRYYQEFHFITTVRTRWVLSLIISSQVSHIQHIKSGTQHNTPETLLRWENCSLDCFFSVCCCSATKESHESVFYTVPISARAVVVVLCFFSTQLGT